MALPGFLRSPVMRPIVLALALSCASEGGTFAAEPIEGIWAMTQKECQNQDADNSRTLIDLTNRENGKVAPLFDQYEHHCKITNISKSKDTATLKMSCFEFWQDYEKGLHGRPETVKIISNDWLSLALDGKKYIRCAK